MYVLSRCSPLCLWAAEQQGVNPARLWQSLCFWLGTASCSGISCFFWNVKSPGNSLLSSTNEPTFGAASLCPTKSFNYFSGAGVCRAPVPGLFKYKVMKTMKAFVFYTAHSERVSPMRDRLWIDTSQLNHQQLHSTSKQICLCGVGICALRVLVSVATKDTLRIAFFPVFVWVSFSCWKSLLED